SRSVSEPDANDPVERAALPPRREMTALRQIKESAQALVEGGKTEEAWELFVSALEAVLVKNRELELLVAKLRRERIGTKSERIDPAQMRLLFEALMDEGGAEAQVDSEAEAQEDAEIAREIESAVQAQPDPPGRKRRKHDPG